MSRATSRIKGKRLNDAYALIEAHFSPSTEQNVRPLRAGEMNPNILIPRFDVSRFDPRFEMCSICGHKAISENDLCRHLSPSNFIDAITVSSVDMAKSSGREPKYLHKNLVDAVMRSFDFFAVRYQDGSSNKSLRWVDVLGNTYTPDVYTMQRVLRGMLNLIRPEIKSLFCDGFYVRLRGDSLLAKFIDNNDDTVTSVSMGVSDMSDCTAWVVTPGYVLGYLPEESTEFIGRHHIIDLLDKFNFGLVCKSMLEQEEKWYLCGDAHVPSCVTMKSMISKMALMLSPNVKSVTCRNMKIEWWTSSDGFTGIGLCYFDLYGHIVESIDVEIASDDEGSR